MRILITGISGFVAKHFVEFLSTQTSSFDVVGIYNETPPDFCQELHDKLNLSLHKINLLDFDKLKNLIASFNPNYIVHLAAKSSVANSWKDPAQTINQNTGIFLNLLESIRTIDLKCRVLSVGSAEEYGNYTGLPFTETVCPNPVNPYGVSRMMQQKLVEIYSTGYGLDIIHTRSFNHIGPYQKNNFVIASFAKQIVEQLNNENIQLTVGNIDITRDFTDVRDVVKAYYQLLLKGKPGNTYNVCSGKGTQLKDIIELFSTICKKEIKYSSNQNNFRPSDNPIMIGSYEKLNNDTSWQPEISLEKSLTDILEYWKRSL